MVTLLVQVLFAFLELHYLHWQKNLEGWRKTHLPSNLTPQSGNYRNGNHLSGLQNRRYFCVSQVSASQARQEGREKNNACRV